MFVSTLKKVQPLLTKPLLKPFFNETAALIPPISRGFARNFNRPNTPRYRKSEFTEPSQTRREEKIRGSTVSLEEDSIEARPTMNQVIKEDQNLNKFMAKIYKTTGISFASSLGIASALAVSLPMTSVMASGLLFGGLMTSLTGICAFCMYPSDKVKERLPNGRIVRTPVSPWIRKIAYSTLVVGSGISLSPLIKVAMLMNPAYIPMAAGMSVFTMVGATLYAKYKPLGSFKAWQAPLYGSLLGLLSVNIISFLLHVIIGPNPLSYAWFCTEMYVGLGLFTMFQMHDTHQAVEAFKNGKYDHLEHAMEFFLNIKNLFVRFLMALFD